VHFANPELIGDGGQPDALQPEVLLYEPQADGSFRLVGFAYALPRADWTAPEPPTFLGQPMTANEELGVWTLRVWTVDNPNGTFADWNPNVSCVPGEGETEGDTGSHDAASHHEMCARDQSADRRARALPAPGPVSCRCCAGALAP